MYHNTQQKGTECHIYQRNSERLRRKKKRVALVATDKKQKTELKEESENGWSLKKTEWQLSSDTTAME